MVERFTYGEAENAVAIMDCLGDWPKDDGLNDQLEGRAGVYRLVLDLGKALDKVVGKNWCKYDWYLTTEKVAEKVREITDKYDLPVNLEAFVRECLVEG